jgi:hypothetical protein
MTTATKAPAAEVQDDAEGFASESLFRRIPGWLRAVAVIGLVLTVALYWWGGLRWVMPVGPSWIGTVAGFLVIWLGAAAAVELLHRHRRHIARHSAQLGRAGARQARRGITGGYSAARAGSGPLWQPVCHWAGPRWHERNPRLCIGGPCAYCDDPEADTADRVETERRFAPDVDGMPAEVYADPAARQRWLDEHPDVSWFGPDADVDPPPGQGGTDDGPGAPAPGTRSPIGDQQMDAVPARTDSRAMGVLALFRQLANAIAEAEPETHEELVALMADGINGFGALAKGYVGLYEHCRDARKLSQASVGALEDVADAVSDCMTAQAYARQKYVQAYEPAAEVAEQHGLPVGARQFFDPGEA